MLKNNPTSLRIIILWVVASLIQSIYLHCEQLPNLTSSLSPPFSTGKQCFNVCPGKRTSGILGLTRIYWPVSGFIYAHKDPRSQSHRVIKMWPLQSTTACSTVPHHIFPHLSIIFYHIRYCNPPKRWQQKIGPHHKKVYENIELSSKIESPYLVNRNRIKEEVPFLQCNQTHSLILAVESTHKKIAARIA